MPIRDEDLRDGVWLGQWLANIRNPAPPQTGQGERPAATSPPDEVGFGPRASEEN